MTLDALATDAALAITAAAIAIAVLLWVTTRSWSPTMPVFLELLLAAGLLRLGATDSWRAIGGAAMIVLIRTLVTWAGAHGPHRRLSESLRHSR
ncbi:MAG: hypothetical protein ACTHJH_05410 [Marmoricola sp.]